MPPQRLPLRRYVTPGLTLAALALAGCTSYEAQPPDLGAVLAELQSIALAEVDAEEVAPITTAFDASNGLTRLEASALAVRRNPGLRALRAQIGVAEAGLVQAGLLADPVIGWDGMDAAAGAIVLGKPESPSWLAGFSLTWTLPRPGELDAKEGVARAGIQAAGARLIRAEWLLVRDVQLAYVRLLAARARAAQTRRLQAIARRALDFFARARQAGAATALEAGLASAAATTVAADLLLAENAEVQARQALNGLLGLPPELDWELEDPLGPLPSDPLLGDAAALVRESLERRPDLQQTLASYQRAEEALRLQVARQWPQLSIGTSFSLQLPIFSQLNQPAIETATKARDAARAQLRAQIHEVRRAIWAARVEDEQAGALLALYRDRVAPQAEEILRLTERAFAAREVTPLEILTAQRQVLESQARFIDARLRGAEARIRLESACGRLLPTARTPLPPSAETEEDSP